jgi:hypothetical protein
MGQMEMVEVDITEDVGLLVSEDELLYGVGINWCSENSV